MIFATEEEDTDTQLPELRATEKAARERVQSLRRELRETTRTARQAKNRDRLDTMRRAFRRADELDAQLEEAEAEHEAAKAELLDYIAAERGPELLEALEEAEEGFRAAAADLGELLADRMPRLLEARGRLHAAQGNAQAMEKKLGHGREWFGKLRKARKGLGSDASPEGLLGFLAWRALRALLVDAGPLGDLWAERDLEVDGSPLNIGPPWRQGDLHGAKDGTLNL